MTELDQKQLGNTLWGIADTLRGAMNADDFRDYMLSFLFLRYLSDNYETAGHKELGPDYPRLDASDRRKTHYVIEPPYLWGSIAEMARTQDQELLHTLHKRFDYIENESFASTFGGLFSEIKKKLICRQSMRGWCHWRKTSRRQKTSTMRFSMNWACRPYRDSDTSKIHFKN